MRVPSIPARYRRLRAPNARNSPPDGHAAATPPMTRVWRLHYAASGTWRATTCTFLLGDDGLVTANELRTSLVAVAAFVAVVVFLDSTGHPVAGRGGAGRQRRPAPGWRAAAVLCGLTARRTRGVERTWRWLMAAGMAGWTVGQAFWSWYQICSDTPLPSPSVADVGYLTMPVFALPALLAFDVVAPGPPGRPGRTTGSSSSSTGRSSSARCSPSPGRPPWGRWWARDRPTPSPSAWPSPTP